MIRECDVLSRNNLVMVIDFMGNIIQLPTDNKNNKTVFVDFKNGIYSLVSEAEYNKSFKKNIKLKKPEEVCESKEITSDKLL